MKPRGPTILAFVAVLATFALAFAFLGTGTASVAELPLHANAGFVTADGTDLQAQLVTSNTSETQGTVISSAWSGDFALPPPAGVVGSADVLGTALGTSRGSPSLATDAGNLGTSTPKELLTPKDQVVSGLDVTISAGIDPNGATDTAAGMTLTRSAGFKAAILFGVLALAMIAGARTATRGR